MNVSASRTSLNSPRHIDAARLFETSARRFSGRIALVAPQGSYNYGALLERTGRLAAVLHSLGVGEGDAVALMLPTGMGFVEAWWGVVRSGAVVVPTSHKATPEDLVACLSLTNARVLLVAGAGCERHAALLRERMPGLRVIGLDMPASAGLLDYETLLASAKPVREAAPRPLDAPCAMYFTAGSTGQPKAVIRSHQSVVWGLSMLARRLDPSEVLLARAPMAHTGGSLTGPFAVLIAGGRLVLPDALSPAAILASVARHRVTALYVHPTVFAKGMLAELEARPVDLSSLRRLQWTAGPLPESVRSALFARFPQLPLEVTFGMTEASNIASIEYAPSARDRLSASNCVGHPLPGAEIRIVDHNGAPVAAGQEGQIETRTPTSFDGYWQDPEATAAALSADGWLRTGDVGYFDELGALHLAGRSREIIKSGGMTVHPAEVEQALARHPLVDDVVVFGLPHADWDEAVVAAVALRHDEAVQSREALLLHCRAHLAHFKIPKAIHLVSALPRNASGKVDKPRLLAMLADPPSAR
jgi:acyl-CoA synthetase (AMP-forming)/AMP-acid ligase II